jgi:hypothetical protein
MRGLIRYVGGTLTAQSICSTLSPPLFLINFVLVLYDDSHLVGLVILTHMDGFNGTADSIEVVDRLMIYDKYHDGNP